MDLSKNSRYFTTFDGTLSNLSFGCSRIVWTFLTHTAGIKGVVNSVGLVSHGVVKQKGHIWDTE
jgi:hypothetical protein